MEIRSHIDTHLREGGSFERLEPGPLLTGETLLSSAVDRRNGVTVNYSSRHRVPRNLPRPALSTAETATSETIQVR